MLNARLKEAEDGDIEYYYCQEFIDNVTHD